MTQIVRRRLVPWDQETLFQVAADIESYPEFIPNCQATRIIDRSEETLLVQNHFRWGLLSKRFLSRAVIKKPQSIEVVSVDAFPLKFLLRWSFEPAESGTEVVFEMELDMPGTGLSQLLAGALEDKVQMIESAYLRRVEAMI